MAEPNKLLDLLKDIDLSHPRNDTQQLDLLLDAIHNSTPSEWPLKLPKSSKIFLKNSLSDQSLVEKLKVRMVAESDSPKFEVEKSHNTFLSADLAAPFDLASKFIVPEKVLGPYIANGNIEVYYNFYTYLNDVKVFFPNEPQAAIILPIRLPRFVIGSPTLDTFTLGSGNVWIRANLLNSAAPMNKYVGMKIISGQLTLSASFHISNKSVTIPKTTQFDLDLVLDNSYEATGNPTEVGVDAKKAHFTPPAIFKTSYSNSQITMVPREVLSGSCFGWTSDLRENTPFFLWDADNQTMLLNLAPDQETFAISLCESSFYNLRGSAKIYRAFWMFPTKALNQNQSLEVKFNGALQLNLLEGISADWDGIRNFDTDVKLNACRLIVYNGEIALLGKEANFNLLHETYTLWQKSAEKPYKMEWDLNFANYKAFTLQVQSTGGEIVAANVDTDFLIDKPLRADNRPIHPKTQNSVYGKGIIGEKKMVVLLDADLLSETDEPDVLSDNIFYQFAIENAYFTTSKEVSVFFNANWETGNHLFEGKLTFSYLLFDILPTLPHPYTTNSLLNIGLDPRDHTGYKRVGALQSIMTWETIDGFTDCAVDFKLTQQKFIPLEQDPHYALGYIEPVRTPSFTLLDVSTESDHWGISLNFENLDKLRKVHHNDVNVTGENVVTISRNNLQAPLGLLEGITLPHVSWEPVYNQTKPLSNVDPKEGLLIQENNSSPTVFSQFSNEFISIRPKSFIKRFIANLKSKEGTTSEYLESSISFTLPNGKLATVSLSPYDNEAMMNDGHLQLIMPGFNHQNLEVKGSLQFRIAAEKDVAGEPILMDGTTQQIKNLINQSSRSILGESVTVIFNNVFDKNSNKKGGGVPLTHIDFSGYGASTFSNWRNNKAKFASISQAKFDILKGRTAHEIVQAVSIIYPYGIAATRTVTFLRNNNAVVFREDTGWVAQSDGLFDFSFNDVGGDWSSPYQIYPGLVEGLFNIRNIREDHNDVLITTYNTDNDDYYFDVEANPKRVVVGGPTKEVEVMLVAVYFDADVKLNAIDEKVTGKQFKGYLQLKPEGAPIPPLVLKTILDRNITPVGGSIDTTFNIEKTLQKFKANRVEVAASYQGGDTNDVIFVASVKGAALLPSEGSWSVVEIDQNTGEVSNLKVGTSVGLIKDGMRPREKSGLFTNNSPRSLLAFADALKNPPSAFGLAYGLLQNTETQKLLLESPQYVQGLADQFESKPALLADCFRLMNSKGPFPNKFDAITIDTAANTIMSLAPAGIKKVFNYEVPDEFTFNIFNGENDAFRIYVKYDSSEADGKNKKKSVIDYITDSDSLDKWTNKMHNLTLAVDLLGFKPIMYITGDFGNGKKTKPSVELGHGPQLKLHPLLQKVYEVLEFLDNLDPTNPSEAIKKGLQIAMSNSADSWEYKFKADKEIPLVKFPFDPISYNAPTTPLKMDAFFRLGVYFNQPIKIPNTIEQIKPSVGAYLELGANMRVMCVSLAAATIYAEGRAEVGLVADLNNPPTLRFKFGFGVELCVGLPVIGSVAVTYMVGIDMKINSSVVVVGAFIYFRGRVELAAGIVTVTISIEAAGQIEKIDDGPTNCVAMCTFALDISVAFVINLNFTETWKETRQIS